MLHAATQLQHVLQRHCQASCKKIASYSTSLNRPSIFQLVWPADNTFFSYLNCSFCICGPTDLKLCVQITFSKAYWNWKISWKSLLNLLKILRSAFSKHSFFENVPFTRKFCLHSEQADTPWTLALGRIFALNLRKWIVNISFLSNFNVPEVQICNFHHYFGKICVITCMIYISVFV